MIVDLREVDRIIDRYSAEGGALISILKDIQDRYRYLPREALSLVSERLNTPLSQVFGVAKFYNFFSLEPKGRHLVCICLGTACHVKGGTSIKAKAESELGINSGETTDDYLFTLEIVRCIGCCSIAPVVRVDSDTYSNMVPDRIGDVISNYREKGSER